MMTELMTRQRRWQLKQAAQGLCIKCGKPAKAAKFVISRSIKNIGPKNKRMLCSKCSVVSIKSQNKWLSKSNNREKQYKKRRLWAKKRRAYLKDYQKKYYNKTRRRR